MGLRYRDYRDGDRDKVLWLDGAELVRRFLLHVLPKGLMRIRHYGFLANRCRAKRLAQIRVDLDLQATERGQVAKVSAATTQMPLSSQTWMPRCPRCQSGQLRLIQVLAVDHAAESKRPDGG